MVIVILSAAGLATLLGALCLYLSAPQQKLRSQPAAPWYGWAGVLMILLSLVLLLQVFGSATSVFVQVSVLMLLWSTVPAWIAYQGSRSTAND